MRELSDKIFEISSKEYDWDLSWLKKTKAKPIGQNLSPDSRWLIIYFHFHQDPEGRYESVIDDQEYILFDLLRDHYTLEVARFRYYYNYNSYADYETVAGAKFQFILDKENKTLLQIGEEILNLSDMTTIEIQEKFRKYHQ